MSLARFASKTNDTPLKDLNIIQLFDRVVQLNNGIITLPHVIVFGDNNEIKASGVWVVGEGNKITGVGLSGILMFGAHGVITNGTGYDPNFHVGTDKYYDKDAYQFGYACPNEEILLKKFAQYHPYLVTAVIFIYEYKLLQLQKAIDFHGVSMALRPQDNNK